MLSTVQWLDLIHDVEELPGCWIENTPQESKVVAQRQWMYVGSNIILMDNILTYPQKKIKKRKEKKQTSLAV